MSIASLPACGELSAQALATHEGRPLRVMQVHALYPTYVQWYYENFPAVGSANFATQTLALRKHGMYGMYIVAPALAKMGCETQFIYANAQPLQMAWAREHGLRVDAGATSWRQQVLAAQIEDFRPDVLFFSDNHYFDGHFVESLAFRPPLVVTWRSAPVKLDVYWKGFDILLSPLRRIRDLAPHLGVGKALPYLFGYSDALARKTENEPKDTDVMFCGTYETPFQPECHKLRRQILEGAARLAASAGLRLRLSLSDGKEAVPDFMRPWLCAPSFGRDMEAEVQRARIGIDCQGWLTAQAHGISVLRLSAGDTVNMRLFENIALGTMTITEARGRLAQYFTPGEEVETYASAAECMEKVHYYALHRDEAERVAQCGRERCLRDYEQGVTLLRLLEIFQQGLRDKVHGSVVAQNMIVPPVPVLQRMLLTLGECVKDSGHEAWELEQNLFSFACALATRGQYEAALQLDYAISATEFSRHDLGALGGIGCRGGV